MTVIESGAGAGCTVTTCESRPLIAKFADAYSTLIVWTPAWVGVQVMVETPLVMGWDPPITKNVNPSIDRLKAALPPSGLRKFLPTTALMVAGTPTYITGGVRKVMTFSPPTAGEMLWDVEA